MLFNSQYKVPSLQTVLIAQTKQGLGVGD